MHQLYSLHGSASRNYGKLSHPRKKTGKFKEENKLYEERNFTGEMHQ